MWIVFFMFHKILWLCSIFWKTFLVVKFCRHIQQDINMIFIHFNIKSMLLDELYLSLPPHQTKLIWNFRIYTFSTFIKYVTLVVDAPPKTLTVLLINYIQAQTSIENTENNGLLFILNSTYRTRAIISRGLYTFLPYFQRPFMNCDLWPYVWLVFKSGLCTCRVY